MSNHKSDGLLGGMINGSALEAIAGIHAAPRTGKETRHILKKSADALPELAEDLATSIQFHADKLSDKSLASWEQTLGRLREAVIAGKSASQQEWIRQSQVHQSQRSQSSTNHVSDYMSDQTAASGSVTQRSTPSGEALTMSESSDINAVDIDP